MFRVDTVLPDGGGERVPGDLNSLGLWLSSGLPIRDTTDPLRRPRWTLVTVVPDSRLPTPRDPRYSGRVVHRTLFPTVKGPGVDLLPTLLP